MNYLLQELVGQHVKVWSEYGQAQAVDDGVLEGFDGVVVKIRKNNGETLYFPIANIRLIKPLQ